MLESRDFPPIEHLGRELGISYSLPSDDRMVLTVPVVAELLTPDGSIQREVLTTVLDEATGYVAVRASLPSWGSTAALAMRFPVAEVEAAGRLEVDARVVKSGSRLVFVDALARWVDRDAATVVAVASGEFAKVGRLGHNVDMDLPPSDADLVVSLARPGVGLVMHYRERIGLRTCDADSGVVELALSPYVSNSSGILHGGVVGALAVGAAEVASGSIAVDATVQYLRGGRIGPFRTSAERLDIGTPGVLWRTEVIDAGADGGLMARATVTTLSP